MLGFGQTQFEIGGVARTGRLHPVPDISGWAEAIPDPDTAADLQLDVPEQVLAITFSNKAAEEMVDRLGEAFPYRSHEFNVYTFHALCWSLVQEFAADVGFRPGFRVLDQTAARVLVRRNIEEFGLRHYLPNSDPFQICL